MKSSDLEKYIQNVPDFPKKGIMFKDILPIFRDPQIFRQLINSMSEAKELNLSEALIAIDARGFLIGSPLALALNKPLIVARKPNKLPGEIISKSYELEYGHNSLSLQEESIDKYNSFAIVDDLLATGGTVKCVVDLLLEKSKSVNCLATIIELKDLKGRDKFSFPIYSQIKY